MTEPRRTGFLNEDQWEQWARTTRRLQLVSRVVLAAIVVSWTVNVIAAFTDGSRWAWTAIGVLPVIGLLVARTAVRLRQALDP